jgi:hypothetical protein
MDYKKNNMSTGRENNGMEGKRKGESDNIGSRNPKHGKRKLYIVHKPQTGSISSKNLKLVIDHAPG